jgi:PAS domain S-box-containing protein
MTTVTNSTRTGRVTDSTLVWLGSAATAITAIALFGKRLAVLLYRAFTKPLRWFGVQTAAAQQVSELAKKVERIFDEVMPNGGNSIKDMLTRVDKRCERLEDAVAMKAQRVRALLTDSTDGVFELDASGNLRWANRTLCRLLGRQTEELLDRGWEQCVAPPEREQVIEEWDRHVEVGRELFMNIHFQHIAGDRVFLQVHSYPMRNEATMKLIGFFAYCRPITVEMERK